MLDHMSKNVADVETQEDCSFIKILKGLSRSDRNKSIQILPATKQSRLNVVSEKSVCPNSFGSESELDASCQDNTSSSPNKTKLSIESKLEQNSQLNRTGSHYRVNYKERIFPGKMTSADET